MRIAQVQKMLRTFVPMLFQVLHEGSPPCAHIGVVIRFGRLAIDVAGGKFEVLRAELFDERHALVIEFSQLRRLPQMVFDKLA